MSLNITGAHSSRVTKSSRKPPPLPRRSSSSISAFSLHPRRKSSSSTVATQTARRKSSTNADDDNTDEFNNEAHDPTARLPDVGLLTYLATSLLLRDVPQQILYISSHMFSPVPETRSGLSSTRIAELLNFRARLPPLVTTAHILALSRSRTTAEREIASLIREGVIKRIRIPGRGIGASAITESLVLSSEWVKAVQNTAIDDQVKKRYIAVLTASRGNPNADRSAFESEDISILMSAGFLTLANATATAKAIELGNDSSTKGTLASLATLAAASGTQPQSPFVPGGPRLSNDNLNESSTSTGDLYFSLPGVGTYLRLLEASRNQLIALLAKSKFKEAPADLLQDRWDGGVAPQGDGARSNRSKGLKEEVLPGKTKKWRQFWGLRFRWVLEECLGTGAVEAFETGSVGMGVRLP